MVCSKQNRFALAAGGLVALCALIPGSSIASTATSTFQVTATSQATCSITSTTPLAFGNYTGSAVSSTTTVQITCTSSTPYDLGINAGTASGATITNRMMTGPASATVNYAVYRDAGHTLNWGTTIGTDTVAGTGNGNAQPITVYGFMAAGQTMAPGSYTDTLTATVTY